MGFGFGLGRSSRGGGTPAFDPASLFGESDQGEVTDWTLAANLFTSNAGTGAITTYGQAIGYAADLSGNGNHAIQATAANRPFWIGLPRTLGSELVTNGRFATDTDWTKGTGWTIGSGVATATAGTASLLEQAITVTAGKTYVLVFNITRTAGTVTAQFTGGTSISGSARNATGSYVEYFVANTNTTLALSKDSAFAGTIFNVTCKEVLTFVCPGAYFPGSPADMTNTSTINMSASATLTMGVSIKQAPIQSGSQNVAVFGAYGSVSGSVLMDLVTQPSLKLWGSAGAIVTLPTTERGSGIASREYCNIGSANMLGAAIGDQVSLRARNTLPTQTTSGSLNGASALANSRFRRGMANFKGWIHRDFVINRALSAPEIANLDAWLMQGKCYAAVIGDSTVSYTASPTPNAQRISDFVGGIVSGAADIAEQGSRIADQLGYWSAIADKTKLQVVIVQIGLNDVKGRVGANMATTAQVITDLQNLINTINADKPTGCRVVIAQMTPCKVWLDAATNAAAANAAWTDVNEAIAGNGATPITGVDARVTSHVAAGNDGSGNLLAIYDHNADGVHESNEYRIIIAHAWRTALESLGLLETAA